MDIICKIKQNRLQRYLSCVISVAVHVRCFKVHAITCMAVTEHKFWKNLLCHCATKDDKASRTLEHLTELTPLRAHFLSHKLNAEFTAWEESLAGLFELSKLHQELPQNRLSSLF